MIVLLHNIYSAIKITVGGDNREPRMLLFDYMCELLMPNQCHSHLLQNHCTQVDRYSFVVTLVIHISSINVISDYLGNSSCSCSVVCRFIVQFNYTITCVCVCILYNASCVQLLMIGSCG